MRLSIIAPGSRGDVQAFVALGTGFRSAGYNVRVATHERFRPLVTAQNLGFAPPGGDPVELFASPDGQRWQAHGHNPVRFWRRMTRLLQTMLGASLSGALHACVDAIISPTLGFLGYHLAEKVDVPCVIAGHARSGAADHRPVPAAAGRSRAVPIRGQPHRRL